MDNSTQTVNVLHLSPTPKHHFILTMKEHLLQPPIHVRMATNSTVKPNCFVMQTLTSGKAIFQSASQVFKYFVIIIPNRPRAFKGLFYSGCRNVICALYLVQFSTSKSKMKNPTF